MILEKRVPWEKPSVTITALWKREAITFGGKFIFLGVTGVTREKTNRMDIFYKGLLFLNPETFVCSFAEFLFIRELYCAPETSRFSFFFARRSIGADEIMKVELVYRVPS